MPLLTLPTPSLGSLSGLGIGFSFLLGLSLPAAEGGAPANALPPADPEKISVLLEKLGAPDYEARHQAMAGLGGLGEQARPFLESAAKGSDLEIAHAAQILLKRINRARIVVKVADAEGKAIAGATVSLNLIRQNAGRLSNAGKQVSLQTDEAGLASLADLEPDMYYLYLGCTPAGYLPVNSNLQNQRLAVGKNEFTLCCRRGGALQGVLLAADKTPLASCRVCLVAGPYLRLLKEKKGPLAGKFLARQRNVETNPQGAFRFDALPEAEYSVAVQSGEKILYTSKSVKLVGDKTEDLGALATEIAAADLEPQPQGATGQEKQAENPPVQVIQCLPVLPGEAPAGK